MDTLLSVDNSHLELTESLRARGVKWVTAMYPDVAGRPRGKVVPVDRLPDLIAGSERYTPRGLDGLGEMNPVEDECVTLPDPTRTWVLPWDNRFAVMPADLSQEGQPYELCGRTILKRQLERAKDLGYAFMLGVETELYVYAGDGSRPTEPLRPLYEGATQYPTPAYLIDAAIDAADFLGPMVEAMDETGFGVFSFDQEGGVGQYEFDFAHDEALAMADKLLLFRLMAKHYAHAAGGFATFMPKPSANAWGSGAHFNMSLESLSGENLFRDQDGGWTPLARSFTAGIADHGRSLAAITNPTVNSYKRLVSSLQSGGVSWAPLWISVGDNNRSCMLRLPRNRPAIENRLVDSAANTYLSAALILAAGLDGIERGLDIPVTAADDTYGWGLSDTDPSLRVPRNLLEAIDAFADDPFVQSVFAKGFITDYVTMKEAEWNSYHETVSDWELRRYLTEL